MWGSLPLAGERLLASRWLMMRRWGVPLAGDLVWRQLPLTGLSRMLAGLRRRRDVPLAGSGVWRLPRRWWDLPWAGLSRLQWLDVASLLLKWRRDLPVLGLTGRRKMWVLPVTG